MMLLLGVEKVHRTQSILRAIIIFVNLTEKLETNNGHLVNDNPIIQNWPLWLPDTTPWLWQPHLCATAHRCRFPSFRHSGLGSPAVMVKTRNLYLLEAIFSFKIMSWNPKSKKEPWKVRFWLRLVPYLNTPNTREASKYHNPAFYFIRLYPSVSYLRISSPSQ